MKKTRHLTKQQRKTTAKIDKAIKQLNTARRDFQKATQEIHTAKAEMQDELYITANRVFESLQDDIATRTRQHVTQSKFDVMTEILKEEIEYVRKSSIIFSRVIAYVMLVQLILSVIQIFTRS